MAGNNLGGQWVPLKQLRVMSQWGGSQRLDFRANMTIQHTRFAQEIQFANAHSDFDFPSVRF
ncbi:hypothetical protein DTL21_05755 [Bremerella cremea]|uniref:Uncharacterized protein n=1 Tax=Blastopirellula marina TaxID=124 RepID=A0A2S8FZ22_9BACT|nr:hypothetical protein C5Y83_05755 [Blastopirellula marina]RCS49834.1 hypothetical protein DTL21_05755 [Bremerella cremea]